MENINKQFETINEILDRIDVKQKEINEKLDELIAALHEYDDENIYKGYDEPNEALLKAAGLYNEAKANKRMDIIGQNGNEGSHYVTNEEADDDARSNNTQTKHVGEKKRNKRYYKPKAK
jgi:seryl-tRNA synthetase